jgi:type IV pilus assembly protein PilY1
LAATGWGDIRANPSPLVTKTVTLGSNTSTISTNTVDWSAKAGWLIDLPTSRERLAVDMEVQFNTLAAVTTIPGGNVCSPSGSSWLYLLNVANGTASGADPVSLGNFIAAGITWIQTSGGDSKLEISGEVVNNKPTVRTTAVGSGATSSGTVRRTSWRELVN